MKKILISVLSLILILAMSVSALAWVHPDQSGGSAGNYGNGNNSQQSGYSGGGGSGGGQNMPTPYIPPIPTQPPTNLNIPKNATPKPGYVPSSDESGTGSAGASGGLNIPTNPSAPTGLNFTIPPVPTPNTQHMRVNSNGWANNEVPEGAEGMNMMSPVPGATATTMPGAGTGSTLSLNWYAGGADLLSANKSITVYDVNTGITWGATYINGSNHADVIPSSSGDAQKINASNITGSYVRRPVIVTIAGTKYAGSMYAVGHGSTSYCSYFKGVMCIHFTGSKTHGTGNVDKDHQSAIQDALNSGL